MKKKFVSIVLAALMVATMTTGCGEPEASNATPSANSNPGTESQTGTGTTGDTGNQSMTSAPETPTSETPTDAPQQTVILDYDQLDAWISYGFEGTSTSGEGVLLGINSESDYGIIIFTDDSDMTAASFLGAFEYNEEYITIEDEVNGLALTFAVTELADGVIELDMGDLGVATVAIQTQPVLMKYLKEIIENYTFVA